MSAGLTSLLLGGKRFLLPVGQWCQKTFRQHDTDCPAASSALRWARFRYLTPLPLCCFTSACDNWALHPPSLTSSTTGTQNLNSKANSDQRSAAFNGKRDDWLKNKQELLFITQKNKLYWCFCKPFIYKVIYLGSFRRTAVICVSILILKQGKLTFLNFIAQNIHCRRNFHGENAFYFLFNLHCVQIDPFSD